MCCKTLWYCTREMTLSWKLLLFVVNRNDYVITIFYCLVFIQHICIYVGHACTHKNIALANIFVYVFFVICGVENDCVVLFISLTKVWSGGLILLTTAPRWGCFTVKTSFSHDLQTRFWGLICRFMNICTVEKTTSSFRLCAPCFREENDFVVTLLLFIRHRFQLEVTLISHFFVALFLAVFRLCVYKPVLGLHCLNVSTYVINNRC